MSLASIANPKFPGNPEPKIFPKTKNQKSKSEIFGVKMGFQNPIFGIGFGKFPSLCLAMGYSLAVQAQA